MSSTTSHPAQENGNAREKAQHNTSVNTSASNLEKGDALLETSAETSPTTTDWDSPDDPENPLNWPAWKRHFHVVPPSAITFAATFGSSVYTPAYPFIIAKWGVSSTVALLPFTLYVLALGFGPMLAAPLSETYGRRIVYLFSVPIASAFTLGAGFSPNIETLCILRFFAGLVFSPALAIGAGSIADVTTPENRALANAIYILTPFLGPALGPVIGAFVTTRKDWRWKQFTIVFFGLYAFLTTAFSQETYKKTIIARRAKRRGLPPAPSPFPTPAAGLKFLLTVTLLRPLHMLVTEPVVIFFSIYVAFNFSVLYAFFAAFPYVFESVYRFSTVESGLVFLALGVGCLLAIPTVGLCNAFLYQPKVRAAKAAGGSGAIAPEYSLFPAMFGSFGIPIGLFWFAWTAKSSISWVSPVLSIIPFAWGNLCIFIAAVNYALDTYEALYGASAAAASGLLRYILGAVFPLFTLQMYQGLEIGWATSLLGFASLVLLPVPWVFFRYGKKFRLMSLYPTCKI